MDHTGYVEDTVRPIPLWGMLILWGGCGYCVVSAAASFLCDPVPDWALFRDDQYGSALFCGGITLLLIVVFTAIFILFRGVRFRIFEDRIEYQKGRAPNFSEVRTLWFRDLLAIKWGCVYDDENPVDTTNIEFHFEGRRFPFQLHKPYKLDSPLAEFCKGIECNLLVPKMLEKLENGETLSSLVPGKYPAYDLRIDREGIRDWDQNRLAWSDIRRIRFSRGETTRSDHFLAQCRVELLGDSGEKLEFDLPRENPYALWNLILLKSDQGRLALFAAPRDAFPVQVRA